MYIVPPPKNIIVLKVTTIVASFLFAVILFFWSTDVHAEYRGYSGEVVSINHQKVYIQEGDAITIEATIKNSGLVSWKNNGTNYIALNVADPFYRSSAVIHPFWHSLHQPAILLETSVLPGDSGTFRFALSAPPVTGIYTEHFMLSAEDKAWMRDTEFSIQMVVGDVKPVVEDIVLEETLEEKILLNDASKVDEVATSTTITAEVDILGDEPIVRVGLYKTVDPVIVTADTLFSLTDTTGGIIETFNPGDRVVTFFDDYSKSFYVVHGALSESVEYAKFLSSATSTIFTITNYDNLSKWQEGVNDNRFRGAIEIRYGGKSESPWVINELPMESYLKGIKETSQISPSEYHKAIAIAARTYAYWHLIDGEKHKGNNFTVDAIWDQVYRGVNTETLISNFSKAIDETNGIVITYDGDIAFTTYFAQSDGRTRSSQEVWGGAYRPWLVSVADPTNKGLKLWGHGVGMSARGALVMASRGSSAESIVTHYYTGVHLEKRY